MGEVYSAHDLHLERDVAIKVLPAGTVADEQARQRFRQEAEAHLHGLEQGYQQRDAWLVELKAWPWFDSLAADRRFQDLLRRMKFSG